MRIARDRSFSQQPDCRVHAAAASALGHCTVQVISRLAEMAAEVGGAHGTQLLQGLVSAAPMVRAAVVPLLLQEASHVNGNRREATYTDHLCIVAQRLAVHFLLCAERLR